MLVDRQRILNQARSWLGYNEKDGSFKRIIDVYNDHRPLPRGYMVKYSDEWCATFVSAVFIKCEAIDMISKECSCERFVSIFKSMGIWVEDGTITPEAGDIILYSWKKHVQPNDCRAQHIGIVESVNNGVIQVIEGNHNEFVGYRKIKVGDGYIRGYGKPKYKDSPKPVNSDKPATTSPVTTEKIKPAKGLNKSYTGTYTTTCGLNLRVGAGTSNKSIRVMPKGTKVHCYGYYTKLSSGKIWYYVQLDDKTVGHCSASYLRRV